MKVLVAASRIKAMALYKRRIGQEVEIRCYSQGSNVPWRVKSNGPETEKNCVSIMIEPSINKPKLEPKL